MRSIAAMLLLAPVVLAAPARAGRPAADSPETATTTDPAPRASATRTAGGDPAAGVATRGATGPRIEVAFVLDATGSMSPYIAEARRRIADIAADLATGEPRPAVRYALVTYRDRGDDYVTRVNPFSPDVAAMRAHLDAAAAGGGGDHPEAVLEGLYAGITELPWTARDPEVLKLIYLVGDAPPQHYDGSPDERAVAAAARARGIVIHTIACGGMNAAGADAFDVLARLTEGRAMALRGAGRRHRAGGDGAGDGDRGSLASAVSGTARAYSASVGVDYRRDSATPVTTAAVPGSALARSGLLGAHVRWVRDPIAWADVWAAHVSTLSDAARADLGGAPAVDFTTHHVVVVGGDGAGLTVDGVTTADGVRAATVRADTGGGVQMLLVPVTTTGGGDDR